MDTITYKDNGDGTFTKTVTHTEIIKDVQSEIDAIKAQTNDMKLGDNQTTVSDVIVNYQNAINVLQKLQAVAPAK